MSVSGINILGVKHLIYSSFASAITPSISSLLFTIPCKSLFSKIPNICLTLEYQSFNVIENVISTPLNVLSPM